jgi:hypothetical protein
MLLERKANVNAAKNAAEVKRAHAELAAAVGTWDVNNIRPQQRSSVLVSRSINSKTVQLSC